MIVDRPIKAILHEASLIPKTVRGLRRLGYPIARALEFLALRVLISERGYPAGKAFLTLQSVRLRTRRDFVMYQALFPLDEYSTHVWKDELAGLASPIILDVGANLGFFSALCLSICSAARMRCFELVPGCAPVIEQRLKESGCRDYQVVVGAVGAGEGETLTIHYDIPYASTNRVEQTQGKHTATVPTLTLDGWYKGNGALLGEEPFLVKIDVEGAERDVILGGRAVLSSARWILIELHESRDALTLLQSTHDVVSDTKLSGPEWVCILKRRGAPVLR